MTAHELARRNLSRRYKGCLNPPFVLALKAADTLTFGFVISGQFLELSCTLLSYLYNIAYLASERKKKGHTFVAIAKKKNFITKVPEATNQHHTEFKTKLISQRFKEIIRYDQKRTSM